MSLRERTVGQYIPTGAQTEAERKDERPEWRDRVPGDHALWAELPAVQESAATVRRPRPPRAEIFPDEGGKAFHRLESDPQIEVHGFVVGGGDGQARRAAAHLL